MRKKVTLKQLARELNLSISTVSKSLKNDSEISQKTITRVHELADFYNYKPNALAVSLKSNKTKTIGVILPEILNHFFAKVLYGIEQEASENGYKIVTCITNESYKKEVEYVEMLNYSSVDGFIVSLSQETQVLNKFEHFKELKRDNVPIVMFDRVTEEIDCDKVIVDDKQASKTAVKYLIDTGCKKIAVITTIGGLSVANLRLEGAREAIGVNDQVSLIELVVKDSNNNEQEIEKFLKNNDIDAVLGLDETAAAITINMSHKLGYKIPENISVIGFTDGLLSKYSYPKLTTVSQHAEDLGVKAAQILVNQLDDFVENHKTNTEIVKTSLILRDSTH
ncbi:LacI family transcriptional regulator [Aquimarina sp. EL_43]|uniref:LacI family DNA-binding transcriptional regulator n=1 Tax=unclassified Aquimarina TaxID=2627091 RepID=UPI0018CB31A5|nr:MULTISPECIES: LacI family DNA-binding transcriptional regulator [unclassified Aquimarina]MBG6130434.1 LacI family transcriptional regulator [Aquimarina sp. EL_35]MBG6149214.1 LacI family transcriptional regulator [Aquimarina sp. EL_32]MBG6168412.1 LacI family transcriptional regulator [Aquimarina sp. EL_43]